MTLNLLTVLGGAGTILGFISFFVNTTNFSFKRKLVLFFISLAIALLGHITANQSVDTVKNNPSPATAISTASKTSEPDTIRSNDIEPISASSDQQDDTTPSSEETGVSESQRHVVSGTSIAGKITYTGQQDLYTYTAPLTGRYRFDFDSDNVTHYYQFLMWDARQDQLADENNGSKGVSVDLEAGQTYQIEVRQYHEFPKYEITINVPNEPTQITSNTIAGNITFEDQTDHYSYTAPRTGRYRFDLDSDNDTQYYYFQMWDAKKNTVANENNGSKGVTVDLEAGQTYAIEVQQYTGFLKYEITVNVPNKPSIINGDSFIGNIIFTDQIDHYSYTAPHTGQYRFILDSNNARCYYWFSVRDSKQNKIANENNGAKDVTVELEADHTYEIQIQQYTDFGEYFVSIEIEY